MKHQILLKIGAILLPLLVILQFLSERTKLQQNIDKNLHQTTEKIPSTMVPTNARQTTEKIPSLVAPTHVQLVLRDTDVGSMALFLQQQQDSPEEIEFRRQHAIELNHLSNSSMKWNEFITELNEPAWRSKMFDGCDAVSSFEDMANFRNASLGSSQRHVHEWLYKVGDDLLSNKQNLYVYRFWLFLKFHPLDEWIFNIWVSHPSDDMIFDENGIAPVLNFPPHRIRFRYYNYSKEVLHTVLQFSPDYGNPNVVDAMAVPWQSDLHRHIILHNYGGFYFDFDTVPMRNLEPIVQLGLNLFPSFPHPKGYTNGHFLYTARPFSQAERQILVSITQIPYSISIDDARGPSITKLQHWLLNDGLPNLIIRATSHGSNLDASFMRMPMGLVDPCWRRCSICPDIMKAVTEPVNKTQFDEFISSGVFTTHTRLYKQVTKGEWKLHPESLQARLVQFAMEFGDQYKKP